MNTKQNKKSTSNPNSVSEAIIDRVGESQSKPWIVICDVSQESDADVQTIQETMRDLARDGKITISPHGNVQLVNE